MDTQTNATPTRGDSKQVLQRSGPCEDPAHGELARSFGATSWTVVMQAARGADGSARDAWDRLAGQYWSPLYALCRLLGDSSHDAEDHVQSFFATLLDGQRIASVDPARGHFRHWLMVAMKRHRMEGWRQATTQRRMPKAGFDPRDVTEVEVALAASDKASPEKAYERQWAWSVLARAKALLRDRYVARGLESRFEPFWQRLEPGATSADHAQLALAFGLSPQSLSSALKVFRQEYRSAVRGVVQETLEDGADVDAELRQLRESAL